MDNIAGSKSSLTWVVHISVAVLVLLWLFPTVGLLVSSFRTADQIATAGWWKAAFPSEQNLTLRAAKPDTQVQEGGLYVIEGNLFGEGQGGVIRYGQEVDEILVDKGRARGVRLTSGEITTADIVVSNAKPRGHSPSSMTKRAAND